MSDDPYVGGENEQEDEREELEAMIEQADLAFASESFGTTALEQEEGESLDDRLKEELPSREPVESGLAIEDEAAEAAEPVDDHPWDED